MTTATHQFKITRQWLLAGNAIFTVKNDKGEHYTYRVRKVEDQANQRPPVWFLSLLTGPDNDCDSSYHYIGMLTFPNWTHTQPIDDLYTIVVKLTKKSKFHPDTTCVKVAQWAINRVCDGKAVPAGYSIDGCGRCGKCGRLLTHPDGVADDGYRHGFGPVCWEAMQGA